MDDEITARILRLVAEHDGQWGWYQLDRALSVAGVVGINVALTMAALVAAGDVVATGDIQVASTRYSLTAQGRSKI